jgi:hypothetical protein
MLPVVWFPKLKRPSGDAPAFLAAGASGDLEACAASGALAATATFEQIRTDMQVGRVEKILPAMGHRARPVYAGHGARH